MKHLLLSTLSLVRNRTENYAADIVDGSDTVVERLPSQVLKFGFPRMLHRIHLQVDHVPFNLIPSHRSHG